MKHKFERYAKLQELMKCRELDIYSLNAEIESPRIQILTDMPRGGEPISTEDKIIKLIEMRDNLNKDWDESIDLRKELEEFLKTINDPIDEMILRYYYFNDMSFDEIGELLRYDRTTISKRHKRIFHTIHVLQVV